METSYYPSNADTPAAPPVAWEQNRRFGFTVAGALLMVAAYAYLRHHAFHPVLVGAGGLLGAGAALVPARLTALRRGWEWLGRALGRANTYVLLTLVYGLVCIPLGWLQRRRGRDPLGRQWRAGAPTYWQPAAPRSAWNYQF